MSYTIVVGDCLDAMRAMEPGSVDAVITDPPYGTEAAGNGYGRRQLHGNGKDGRKIENDVDLTALEIALPGMVRVLRPDAWLAVFCGARRRSEAEGLLVSAGLSYVGEVIWDKAQPGLGYTIRYLHETAIIVAKGEPPRPTDALLSIQRAYMLREGSALRHPHEKPVSLMAALVQWACPAGGIVLDPFMGSGSTGVACVQEGRRFVGVELDPHWAEVARQRLTEAVPSLFHQPHIQQEIA